MTKLYDIDANYQPFSMTRLIMDNLAHFNMEELRKMTGADMWGLYIKRDQPLSYKVLYNGYIKDINEGVKLRDNVWDDFNGYVEAFDGQKFRDDIWKDFNVLTNRVLIGDTIVVLMYKSYGFSVHATRVEADKWTYKFFHHPKYGMDFPNKKPENFVAGEGANKIEIDSATLQSIKGHLTTVKWSSVPRQSLEVKLNNNTIIVLTLEPCISESKDEMLYNAIIDLYDPAVVEGRDVWIQSDKKKKVLGDWTLGWKFLQWLDKASMWKKCWGGGLAIA